MVLSLDELMERLRGEFPNVSYSEVGTDIGEVQEIFVSEVPAGISGWHLRKFAKIAKLKVEGEELWPVGDWGNFISEGRRRYESSHATGESDGA